MNKPLFSTVAIGLALFGALGAFIHSTPKANAGANAPLPSVSSVLPSLTASASVDAPRIITASTVTIFADRPAKRSETHSIGKVEGKVWTCGAFRALENDATQQVRECGWK